MNDNNVGPYSSYQIGRLTGLQCNLDIAEIVAFESELSDDEADKIESYLAHKWGLADQLLWSSLQGQARHSQPPGFGGVLI